MKYAFLHENLDAYQLAVDFDHWAIDQVFPTYRGKLRDQLLRASSSMVLNIAEGAGHPPGKRRRDMHRVALGSAAECCAVLDLVRFDGVAERQNQLRRVGAMLGKMIQR